MQYLLYFLHHIKYSQTSLWQVKQTSNHRGVANAARCQPLVSRHFLCKGESFAGYVGLCQTARREEIGPVRAGSWNGGEDGGGRLS